MTEHEIDILADAITEALMSVPGYAEFTDDVVDLNNVAYCEVCGSQPACTEIQGYEVGGEPDELRWVSYAVCAGCLRMAERGRA